MEEKTSRGGRSGDSPKLPLKKPSWLLTPPTSKDDHEEETAARSSDNNCNNVSSLMSEDDHHQERLLQTQTCDDNFNLNELFEVPIINATPVQLLIKRSYFAASSQSKHDHEETDRKGKKPIIIDDSDSTKKPCDQPSTLTDNHVTRLLHDITKRKKYENVTDKKLIIIRRKRVENSDTLEQQSRISIPKGLILAEFLTESEKELLEQKDGNGKLKKINVTVIGGLMLKEYRFKLSRRDYEDGFGYRYALKSSQLSQFKLENELHMGDTIRVASFRSNGRLYLLIVNKVSLTWGTRRPRTKPIYIGSLKM